MAKKIEETMAFVNEADNLMSFGKSFATLNGQPLDKASIFSTKAKAEEYARSASAYVGKIVVVAEGTSGEEIVTAYVINSDNTLKAIGDKSTMDDLASKIKALQEKDQAHDASIETLTQADVTINGRIDAIDEANAIRDNKIAGLEDNFTGDDAKNALSLGGHAAAEYQLSSELKALAKKDKVAKEDLTTELSAELDAKAVAETVNAELSKKANTEDVNRELALKATVIAQEATEAKAQENKEAIAAMDTAYKAADTVLDTRLKSAEGKLANVTNVMDFVGAVEQLPEGEALKQYQKGDVIVVTSTGKEYVFDGKAFVEFGDTSAQQTAITKLQEADVKHDELLAGLESNKATKTEVSTLSGKVDKKAEQSALDDATGRITAVEGEVDTLNAKPAFGITSTQISSWDQEVGAKAKATENAQNLASLTDRVDVHDTTLEELRTDVDSKQTVNQVNTLIQAANISTDKLVNGSEEFILNGGSAE